WPRDDTKGERLMRATEQEQQEAIDKLGTAAADFALSAALQYLRVHHLTADPDALLESLKAHVRARLPESLAEARQALDCNMVHVANRLFMATMALAGVDAAREVGRAVA